MTADDKLEYDNDLRPEVRSEAERKLRRKLDCRLMPTIVVICMMNYIDRAAITAGRLKGLQSDLHITDVQYDTAIAILFASYCPAQILSNMILNRNPRPSLYISSCVILWGLISALTGVTKSFSGILACRLFLGLPEAAYVPGCAYLLSRWYTRKEIGLRYAILYAGFLISYAFGSLWAAAILGHMNGALGIAAWRWKVPLNSMSTVISGNPLPRQPTNTRWLTAEEKHLAQLRLAEDAGEADTDPQDSTLFSGLVMALKDPKVYLFVLLGCFASLGTSFTNFFPTLTATLGYSTVITLLLAAPPWILPAIVGLANAWHADRTGERFFHLTVWWWIPIVGYIISLSTMATAARYFSLYMMTLGLCGNIMTYVWVTNTISRPPAKRSAALGLVNGMASVINVVGSYVWPARWGPQYHQSMLISMGSFVLAAITAFGIRWVLIRENERMKRHEMISLGNAERERVEIAAQLEGVTFDEALRLRKGFRYPY
ncbi:major facilitator superfamily domain-containing protein [Scleroderma citrinum]